MNQRVKITHLRRLQCWASARRWQPAWKNTEQLSSIGVKTVSSQRFARVFLLFFFRSITTKLPKKSLTLSRVVKSAETIISSDAHLGTDAEDAAPTLPEANRRGQDGKRAGAPLSSPARFGTGQTPGGRGSRGRRRRHRRVQTGAGTDLIFAKKKFELVGTK
jgi:hypothetical protein